MSKLYYVVSVWGGFEKYLISALQMVQNMVMRAVCKRYHIKKMLQELNWLSFSQLIVFHSIMQSKKVLDTKQPSYFYDRLVGG